MVAVVNRNNKPLMPTSEYRARKLLRAGRAVIHKYRPYFTIRIVDLEDGAVQSVEYKSDTGYYHVGISICSEANECVSMQTDMLANEKEKHTTTTGRTAGQGGQRSVTANRGSIIGRNPKDGFRRPWNTR